ncbi:hypothetical protein ESCO_006778 [Escovopsis weberi]|uniref:Uncharacterized protein n=1 Tax=Escovopsis weberi TaxID=150374 RepID=A0A0M9VVR4_ESCWE|nr:hypothetical protein ESCO_006778 [Escovopsis weberi]
MEREFSSMASLRKRSPSVGAAGPESSEANNTPDANQGSRIVLAVEGVQEGEVKLEIIRPRTPVAQVDCFSLPIPHAGESAGRGQQSAAITTPTRRQAGVPADPAQPMYGNRVRARYTAAEKARIFRRLTRPNSRMTLVQEILDEIQHVKDYVDRRLEEILERVETQLIVDSDSDSAVESPAPPRRSRGLRRSRSTSSL